MINPFACNQPGPLRKDELVRIYKVYDDGGIVLEKSYDVSSMEDIGAGLRRMASRFYYLGTSKEMIDKWNKHD